MLLRRSRQHFLFSTHGYLYFVGPNTRTYGSTGTTPTNVTMTASGTFAFTGGLQGTGAQGYGLTNKNAIYGQNLYRLKTEDINNKTTYLQIMEVTISADSNADKIQLYPNPARSVVDLEMLDKTNGNTFYNISVSNS